MPEAMWQERAVKPRQAWSFRHIDRLRRQSMDQPNKLMNVSIVTYYIYGECTQRRQIQRFNDSATSAVCTGGLLVLPKRTGG